MRRSMLNWLLVVLSLIVSSTYGMSATYAASGGKYLSQRELLRMYRGKTWIWKDGGGYFRSSGKFKAQSGSGRKNSRVKGGWWAYRKGKVCFSGTWKSPSGSGFDSSCFAHKRVGNTIYQRRLPSGRWYVFKHARAKKRDEYRNLARGDYSDWYAKYKRKKVAKSTRSYKKRTYRKKTYRKRTYRKKTYRKRTYRKRKLRKRRSKRKS